MKLTNYLLIFVRTNCQAVRELIMKPRYLRFKLTE